MPPTARPHSSKTPFTWLSLPGGPRGTAAAHCGRGASGKPFIGTVPQAPASRDVAGEGLPSPGWRLHGVLVSALASCCLAGL